MAAVFFVYLMPIPDAVCDIGHTASEMGIPFAAVAAWKLTNLPPFPSNMFFREKLCNSVTDTNHYFNILL